MNWKPHNWEAEEGFDALMEEAGSRLETLNQQLTAARRAISDFNLQSAIAAFEDNFSLMSEGATPLCFPKGRHDYLLEELRARMAEIEDALKARFGLDLPHQRLPMTGTEETWSLGTRRVLLAEKEILRGKLILGQDTPLIQPLRSLTVLFLWFLKIDGLRDELIRESHGHWGYHYHYWVHRSGRSDTILSFKGSTDSPTLCHEKHSERNSKAEARPHAWKNEKRESIYSACLPDLRKWEISEFKVPGADAGVVWPL